MGYWLVELDSLYEDTAEDYMDGDRLHDSLSTLGVVALLQSSPTSVGEELMSESICLFASRTVCLFAAFFRSASFCSLVLCFAMICCIILCSHTIEEYNDTNE